jgi:hypothetical protein
MSGRGIPPFPPPLKQELCIRINIMQNEPEREPTLAEMEEEVLAEGREWMRQRLQQKLQEQADRISRIFFPQGRAFGPRSKKRADTGQQRRLGPSPD